MRFNSILFAALAAGIFNSCFCFTEKEPEPVGEYRNIAVYHPTYHSSAINYDLTAQLATDGIVEELLPAYHMVYLNGEPIIKQDRDWLFDYRHFTTFKTTSNALNLEVRFFNQPVRMDRMVFKGKLHWIPGFSFNGEYDYRIQYTTDGTSWQDAYSYVGPKFPLQDSYMGTFEQDVTIAEPEEVYGVRIISADANMDFWEVKNLDFYLEGQKLELYNEIPFCSCWIPELTDEQPWLYVDLGQKRSFNKLVMHWLSEPQCGAVLVSDDAKKWRELAAFEGQSAVEARGYGRYVKIQLCPSAKPLCLTELEVWGWSDQKPEQKAWKVVREDLQDNPAAWVSTDVPSTVLAAYLDAGMLPDPAFGDNNQQISDSYFRSNFLYRGTLTAPEDADRIWLNFDGINWKADVFLNGIELGHIKGAFIRTCYDVTDIVRPGDNEIEVLIHANDHMSFGKGNTLQRDAFNGGILGVDNPTFHASIGWDWIPAVHGRNIGIWNDVYFSTTGEVSLKDPFVSTVLNLPDTTLANVTVSATLVNNGVRTVDAVWTGTLGEYAFSKTVRLRSGQKKEVSQTICIENPALWWPNGYGEQNLYDVHMDAVVNEQVSDTKNFVTGLRQNTYSDADGRLTVWVNGKRFSGRGGNWGFSEYNLRYREREYDIAVGLHAEENFTMIRNWVGQTMDDEFYEACDRHGIMVWQDFWLANPLDGPDPADEDMFMDNANDFLCRVRNHPCMVLYVGRNEGCPPPSLDAKLRNAVAKYHPEIFYTPDSSHGIVGGNGHYNRFPAREFFSQWTEKPNLWGQNRVHSEKGMPNVPNYESVVKFIPEEHLWPQDDMWGVHDWTLNSAQKVGTFNDAVWKMFGEPKDAKQFCEWAQWVNYDGYRAIFESRSEQRRGLTLWMSHAAWPTFVWCTYDYYFDPTAAFYGCKKANEPIHIMWNPLKQVVEVMNYSAGDKTGLTASATVLNMMGEKIKTVETRLDSKEDSTFSCFSLDAPEGESVYYYSLCLEQNGKVLSENFYVLGAQEDNFQALHNLPKARLQTSESSSLQDGVWTVEYTITNTGSAPAMMMRLLALKGKGGDRILPVHYSDNYFHLLPGQTKTVTVKALGSDCDGAAPYIVLSGFNYGAK